MPLKPDQSPVWRTAPLLLPPVAITGHSIWTLSSAMYDASNMPCDTLRATYEYDDRPPPASLLRPQTPLPDGSRTLRRTISYASIDTIHPSNNKGIRRRISEMAENLKSKSSKKKKRDPSAKDATKDNATHGRGSDSNVSPASKATKHGRGPAAPLRDASHKSEEKKISTPADRLHSGVPSELDTPSTTLSCASISLADEPLLKEDEQPWENDLFPNWSLEPGANVTADGHAIFRPPRKSQVDIKDVQFHIRSSESDTTIWDGLRASVLFFLVSFLSGSPTDGEVFCQFHNSTQHLFKCRLYLQCVTHSHDSVSLPTITRFEMHCSTHPVSGTRYARPPILQMSYAGASPRAIKNSTGLPNMKLADGIHVDQFWRTTLEDDGTWGWCRDAYIPISPRLFDAMDYRKFKVASRVLLGESRLESQLMFGISMLLREVEMK